MWKLVPQVGKKKRYECVEVSNECAFWVHQKRVDGGPHAPCRNQMEEEWERWSITERTKDVKQGGRRKKKKKR